MRKMDFTDLGYLVKGQPGEQHFAAAIILKIFQHQGIDQQPAAALRGVKEGAANHQLALSSKAYYQASEVTISQQSWLRWTYGEVWLC